MIPWTELFKKRGATRNRFASLLFLFALSGAACNSPSDPQKTSVSPADQAAAALLSKGKAVYQAHCIACHNSNPKMAGAVGPEIWGSSQELIQARVIHGTYPKDYTPKRKTKLMVPLPQLESDLAALHTYLNSP